MKIMDQCRCTMLPRRKWAKTVMTPDDAAPTYPRQFADDDDDDDDDDVIGGADRKNEGSDMRTTPTKTTTTPMTSTGSTQRR